METADPMVSITSVNSEVIFMFSLYKQQLNLGNCTFLRIKHEDAIVAVVYKVIQPDGTSLILKTCSRPPDYFREIYFLKHFVQY